MTWGENSSSREKINPKVEIHFPPEFILALRELIADAVADALAKTLVQKKNSADEWLCLEQAKKLLPLHSKTSWQKLRDKREIEFSQINRKILYRKQSILSYIEKHKIK